ncbi:MAG: response regulator [Saprospiraceae bacterium]
METEHFKILLADDDEDDCMFFKEALDELSLPASLNTVNNGMELMNFLETHSTNLPHMLFLDLNMPRKTGFDCLSEIKRDERLKQLPVIIYSTSSNPEVMDWLYHGGAHHYIRKPADFASLKSVINKAIVLCRQHRILQPPKDKFVINP